MAIAPPIDRRHFLGGAASLSALALSPERVFAAAANRAAADWGIAFADLESDLAPAAMARVQGRAPRGLTGTLYRNGGARFRRPKGSATHWFDGDGLIRAFRIADGRASLAARFVDTPRRRADAVAGAVISGGFGTAFGPDAQIATPDDANAANISVIARGAHLWALWEAGSPTAIDPASLATLGPVTLREDLAHMPFLAHPRFEPDGRLWSLGQAGDRAVIWQVAQSGALIAATPIDLPRASYIHDFTLSHRHLVIVLQPWVYARAAATPLQALDWQPALGTQVLILDKADLSRRRVVELPPFFAFHLTPAEETPAGEIRFAICASPDVGFVTRSAVDLLNGIYTPYSLPILSQVTVPPRGPARIEPTAVVAEFPRGDDRYAGAAQRFTLHATLQAQDRPLFQGVGVFDWAREQAATFDFGAAQLVEEMVFVPRPGGQAELDGWIVGTTINLAARRTELHVFEARSLGDGPVVTWAADLAIPAGLHGTFVASRAS